MATYTNDRKKQIEIHGVSYFFKRIKEMAELKWVATILQVSGYTAYIYALFLSFANVDRATRAVLSILGAIFLLVKIIDFCATRIRKHKYETEERRALAIKNRREDIDTYERENDIIRGFKGE
jgi:hypothetical protein